MFFLFLPLLCLVIYYFPSDPLIIARIISNQPASLTSLNKLYPKMVFQFEDLNDFNHECCRVLRHQGLN